MADEFDTKWFDLKNYEALKTMSISGWATVIRTRYELYNFANDSHSKETVNPTHSIINKINKGFSEWMRPHRLKSITTAIKKGIDAQLDNKVKSRLYGDSFSTASVNSTSSYNLAILVENYNLSIVWDACQYMYDFEQSCKYDESSSYIPDTNLLDIADAPIDVNIRQYMDSSSPLAYVEVNLSATDEQIKNDFSHWLTHYRKTIDYQVPKKPAHKKLFTQTNFDYWVKFGVIPYLDLKLIAKIESKEITQDKMAQLIFPEEFDVDTTGRLRQVTIPEADRLIKNKIHKALALQFSFEKTTGMKNA